MVQEDNAVNNKRFVRDMGWYLLGSIIPMGIGFVKTPIFTRYFTPEEYGYLGLITITFSYFSIFLYSWLSSCLWRYYNAFKNKSELKGLYSNLFLIFAGTSLLLLAISLIWVSFAELPLVRNLIILSFFQFLIKELIGLYLITLRLEGKAVTYNLIHSLRAVLTFSLLYVMAFVFHFRITSVLISAIAIDMIVLVVILLFIRHDVSVSFRLISRATIRLLFRFGSIGLVSNFFFLLITTSDRYLIAYFTDMTAVGIYNQVYNICQLSIVALATVYFNTINPRLNKELEADFNGSAKLVQDYLYAFLLFGLPVVTYLSLFPTQIAQILLGEAFRSGYVIMPWIFVSAFFYGLYLFIELRFKFSDRLKNLALGVIIASILDVALNFILIPKFGYQMAAISTFVSYTFILIYFFGQDDAGFFRNRLYLRNTLYFILILLTQVFIDQIARQYFEISLWQTIGEGIIFLAIYLVLTRKQIQAVRIII
jgi:O-antigen/teichoic acid export membrane protein